jgi:hypothetical protein
MAIVRNRVPWALVTGLVALSAMQPALAQQPTVLDLQKEIESRDKMIADLSRRIEALEKASHPAPRPAALAGTGPAVPSRPPQPVTDTGRTGLAQFAPFDTQAPAAPGGTGTLPATTAPIAASPPDQESLERALENTLVNQGGLLLPPYTVQLVPDVSYAYQDLFQLAFAGNGTSLVTQRSRRDLFEAGLGLRVGLPWETQFSVRVPYGWDSGQTTFAGTSTIGSRSSGIGDVTVGLQKQIWHESGWTPDLLLSLVYSANTGSSSLSMPQVSSFPFSVGTGSGFNSIIGGITALKRQDPLVFLGSFNYQHSFAATIGGRNQQIGDAYEFRLSPILAASPDTSLRVAFDTTFQTRGSISGSQVPGSDQVISFLEFGVGSVLSAKLFLDSSVAIGLTKDSPNFRLLFSLPFRF